MKFLMIDDSEYKIDQIKPLLKNQELDVAMSYRAGVIALMENEYDGVILDMTFPLFDNEPNTIEKDLGLRVLSEMKRKKIEVPTVIYSSDKTDVSSYKIVKGYIINNNCYIGDDVKKFIELCQKHKIDKIPLEDLEYLE